MVVGIMKVMVVVVVNMDVLEVALESELFVLVFVHRIIWKNILICVGQKMDLQWSAEKNMLDIDLFESYDFNMLCFI